MVTTTEVEVEEDWTSTVASTPIMSPTTGFRSKLALPEHASGLLAPDQPERGAQEVQRAHEHPQQEEEGSSLRDPHGHSPGPLRPCQLCRKRKTKV
ncbi:hypothetical protein CEXT_815241 [Caerostris extrusa]|uniref:Uncharacterized protein n=1 Tax=Caerostris extrusa TaxID=172846 RepID=A0AAV4RUT1_CAEEX|nr:hypothetical protein CEXT_815241 [Caerostris extrusa]